MKKRKRKMRERKGRNPIIKAIRLGFVWGEGGFVTSLVVFRFLLYVPLSNLLVPHPKYTISWFLLRDGCRQQLTFAGRSRE